MDAFQKLASFFVTSDAEDVAVPQVPIDEDGGSGKGNTIYCVIA